MAWIRSGSRSCKKRRESKGVTQFFSVRCGSTALDPLKCTAFLQHLRNMSRDPPKCTAFSPDSGASARTLPRAPLNGAAEPGLPSRGCRARLPCYMLNVIRYILHLNKVICYMLYVVYCILTMLYHTMLYSTRRPWPGLGNQTRLGGPGSAAPARQPDLRGSGGMSSHWP